MRNADNVLSLRQVNAGDDSSDVDGGRGLSTRVAALESELKHFATKGDLSKLKVWMVVGASVAGLQFVGMVALFILSAR